MNAEFDFETVQEQALFGLASILKNTNQLNPHQHSIAIIIQVACRTKGNAIINLANKIMNNHLNCSGMALLWHMIVSQPDYQQNWCQGMCWSSNGKAFWQLKHKSMPHALKDHQGPIQFQPARWGASWGFNWPCWWSQWYFLWAPVVSR